MKNRNRVLGVFCVVLLFYCNNAMTQSAVTYNFSGGRLGDNIVVYMLAKWVAYKYNMPLLYKPFAYSDQFVFHDQEKHFESEIKNYSEQLLFNENIQVDFDSTRSVVYSVSMGMQKFFSIDWSDEKFIKELKEMIAPKVKMPQMDFPQGCITVAVHVRKGNYEKLLIHEKHPSKFIDEQFYIDQIAWLYEKCKNIPLYVFIFTDDENPEQIRDRFEKQLKGLRVIVDCRKKVIGRNCSVIEDYFSFFQFDCFIHGFSHFALTASKIGDFYIDIQPARKGSIIISNEKKAVEKRKLMPAVLINYYGKQNV